MASNSNRKRKKTRNYALEYLIRKARGLEDGRSLAQARGHARAVDLPSGTTPHPFKRSEPLENGLKLMKQGVSQKEAAKQVGVSPERLRRFQQLNTTSQRKKGSTGSLPTRTRSPSATPETFLPRSL